MSIYQRCGQGPFTPSGVKIDGRNVDEYYAYAVRMDAEIKWVESYLNLSQKLKTGSSEYSVEYLEARMAKLKGDQCGPSVCQEALDLKSELNGTNAALLAQLPIVMDKITGQNPDEHRKMSALDDRRKELEDGLIAYYREQYPLLHEVLPKIFFLIIDGCDMTTVQSCFTQLKKVLLGEITSKNATSNLMTESTEKYNLPAGFWDVKKGDGKKA
jgi:hypothetical protein